MLQKATGKYRAAMYLRLSKDDGDEKIESGSISNQRELIKEYVKNHPEINLCDEMVDDGYSGKNFERPGFKRLISEIEKGKINCVIVKDQSRFAREYVGLGYYVDEFFPKYGVRLICVNENYDTLTSTSVNDAIMFNIKNVINDSYLRDLSVKIRSHLEIKRKRGEYIGAFVAYGYLKDEENGHKIVIDENVAPVIRKIFYLKIDGLSALGIANQLNDAGVDSPLEYKKKMGSKFCTGFKTDIVSKWSANTVSRILKNRLYIGVLEQGKATTVSHKISKVVTKDREDWIVIEDNHPAIVSKEVFAAANNIMLRDTRKSPNKNRQYLFSGLLYCYDCHDSMIRNNYKYKGVEHPFYVCRGQKLRKSCTNHNINEDVLEKIVLAAINVQIGMIVDLEKAAKLVSETELNKSNLFQIDKLIREKHAEIEKRKLDIFRAHESMTSGIITREEFADFKQIYNQQIADAEKSIENLQNEQRVYKKDKSSLCAWMKQFTQLGTISSLSRKLLVMLVDKIYITDQKGVHIVFKYSDELKTIKKIVECYEKNQNKIIKLNVG